MMGRAEGVQHAVENGLGLFRIHARGLGLGLRDRLGLGLHNDGLRLRLRDRLRLWFYDDELGRRRRLRGLRRLHRLHGIGGLFGRFRLGPLDAALEDEPPRGQLLKKNRSTLHSCSTFSTS